MKVLPTCTGTVAMTTLSYFTDQAAGNVEKFDLPGWQILSCNRTKIEHERRMATRASIKPGTWNIPEHEKIK